MKGDFHEDTCELHCANMRICKLRDLLEHETIIEAVLKIDSCADFVQLDTGAIVVDETGKETRYRA